MLPEGWIKVTHNSGLPIYLHKVHRVCTVSRPYFLGPGSVRKHEIPISAIPCLNYKKAIEKEEQLRASQTNGSTITTATATATEGLTEEGTDVSENVCPVTGLGSEVKKENGHSNENGAEMTNENTISAPTTAALNPVGPQPLVLAKIETVAEHIKEQSLNDQQLNDYCKSLFIFKKLRVMRFK